MTTEETALDELAGLQDRVRNDPWGIIAETLSRSEIEEEEDPTPLMYEFANLAATVLAARRLMDAGLPKRLAASVFDSDYPDFRVTLSFFPDTKELGFTLAWEEGEIFEVRTPVEIPEDESDAD